MKTKSAVTRALVLLASFSWPMGAFGQISEPTLSLDLGAGARLEMALVKADRFRQGSPSSEADRGDDETLHDVTITSNYYIGKYEVTVSQFERFVAETGYKTEAEKGTSGGFGWNGRALEQRPSFNWKTPGFTQTEGHPVTVVTFNDAMAFANWLSRRTGRSISLPSEAQWELAARGDSTSAYPSGARKVTEPQALGWSKANATSGTHPVGEKLPNGIGLFDMAGNVAEWCLDWYGPYGALPLTDPIESRSNLSDKPRRVLRGGSWLRDAKHGRSAARYRNDPGSRNADNGFRVVASLAAAKPAAAPLASVPAPAAPAPSEDRFGALAKLAMLLLSIFFGGKLVARLFGRGGSPGVKTEITPDGFTLKAPQVPMGHRIHYRYMVDGKSTVGNVVLSADPSMGQTVYTGGRPSSIQILGVTAPGQNLPMNAQKSSAVRDDRLRDRTDDDSFRGYPSAYR